MKPTTNQKRRHNQKAMMAPELSLRKVEKIKSKGKYKKKTMRAPELSLQKVELAPDMPSSRVLCGNSSW